MSPITRNISKRYRFVSYKESYDYIKTDYERYKNRMPNSYFDILYLRMREHGFNYIFWMRLAGVKGFLYPLCKIMQKRLSTKYGMLIQPETQIGKGLYLGHGFIVVNPTTIIGDYCNLSQFTTIGSSKGKAAEIGNHVYIGPNVCLVENVHIGDYAKVGAGAVVIKDVPAYATAVGVPARNILKDH